MSKELRPLEAWEEVKDEMLEWTEGYEENFDIIESALKRLDIIETAYKDLQNKYDVLETEYFNQRRSMLKYDDKLTAFDIIIKKNVCISVLKDSSSVEEYNDIVCYHKTHSMAITTPLYLEKEEYDFLKDILL